jgi:hypothetical protein
MKMTHAELLEKVRDDIAAFKVLDAQVFPIGDTILTPPTKKVCYEFLPWDDQDTAVVKEKAQNTTELTKQITVYPNVLSDISRVSFCVNDGTKETFTVRRGIYVLIAKQSNNGGEKILREYIPEELLPLYLSWTIENKVQKILDRY